MTEEDRGAMERRKLVAALGTGAVVLGAAALPREAVAQPARWQPTLEKDDDWMEIPGRHRLVFDATSADGAAHALRFASNYIGVNKSAYGIEPSQLATLIILRHMATGFGYGDAIWAKYGRILSDMAQFTDPKTKEAPTRNLYDVKGAGLGNADATLSELAGKGVLFAVCGAATQRIVGMVAAQTKGKAEEIRHEFESHLVPKGRIVPAGIVTVNRAQERGYAMAYYTP